MSQYRVRLTLEAMEDLKRLQEFLIDNDPAAAARALAAVRLQTCTEWPLASMRRTKPEPIRPVPRNASFIEVSRGWPGSSLDRPGSNAQSTRVAAPSGT